MLGAPSMEPTVADMMKLQESLGTLSYAESRDPSFDYARPKCADLPEFDTQRAYFQDKVNRQIWVRCKVNTGERRGLQRVILPTRVTAAVLIAWDRDVMDWRQLEWGSISETSHYAGGGKGRLHDRCAFHGPSAGPVSKIEEDGARSTFSSGCQ